MSIEILESFVEKMPAELHEAMHELIDVIRIESSGISVEEDEFFHTVYQNINAKLLDDVTIWGEVGTWVWTLHNRKNAADYDDFYKNRMEGILLPRVRKILLEIKDIVLAAEEVTLTDMFAGRTLDSRYLMRDPETRNVVETPTRMRARAAAGAFASIEDDDAYKKYVLLDFYRLSRKCVTKASPGLSNAGTLRQMLSSCFLIPLGVNSGGDPDSMRGISQLLAMMMCISAAGGGIGFTFPVRSRGQLIKGSGGLSKGVVDALLLIDHGPAYCDQGGNRGNEIGGGRPGSWACFFEPHHPDLIRILESKREMRTSGDTAFQMVKRLFLGLWVSDLFMKRVRGDQMWSFFSPDTAPGLEKVWGEEYTALYETYEAEGRETHRMPARDVWNAILNCLMETSGPYIMYKDTCNALSNQQNLGTIQCSNLCTEIVEFTSEEEVAVCNLASISIPAFADPEIPGGYNWKEFRDTVRITARALYHSIYSNTYPVPEAEHSNKRRRPIAIGVQGFHQALMINRWPWASQEARDFNRRMIMYMYYEALDIACVLCEEGESAYDGFEGSPLSMGLFAWDLFAKRFGMDRIDLNLCPDLDWISLRERIVTGGVAMSLVIALMPTASTSQILGNYESFHPIATNAFVRSTGPVRATVVNPHLVKDLKDRGLWTVEMSSAIKTAQGILSDVPKSMGIPDDLLELYKTVYEIPISKQAEFVLDRVPFVDQAQSTNWTMRDETGRPPIIKRLHTLLFYLWEKGSKNGVYYFKPKPIAEREGVSVASAPSRLSALDSLKTTSAPFGDTHPVSGEVCMPGCDNCGA